ncbi:MAG: hypothetical protein JXR35_12620 [Rhodobacteraceae bacterium]|nr:hypothetical protein [Paracoccaceae bacterium]
MAHELPQFDPKRSAHRGGHGGARGQGHGGGMGLDRAQRHHDDQADFHALLKYHDQISRSVTNTPDGIVAETRSDDPAIAALIRKHAHAMHARMVEKWGLRHWDPAFAEIFAQADKVELVLQDLPDGVRAVERSDDPNVAILIRAHGAVVSAFVNGGAKVAAQESPLPEAYIRMAGSSPVG